MKHNSSKSAFTLIELSIVLVIIGLIVGGVLVGQDLIRAAEDRAIISYREKLQTGINTFRLKYNGLPGDLKNAESFWGSDASCPNTPTNTTPKEATCNGDGDRQIDGLWVPSGYPSILNGRETHRFWQHLANAGLIAGQYTGAQSGASVYWQQMGVNSPKLDFGDGIGISTLGHVVDNVSIGGYYSTTLYNVMFFIGTQDIDLAAGSFISPTRVYGIDTKIDDGKPGTGVVTVYAPNFAPAANCASSSTASTATYLLTETGKTCMILLNERL